MSETEDREFQAFNDLQRQLIDITEKQKIAQQQLSAAQQAHRRSNLTVRELSALPAGIPTYKATGKAYFRLPQEKLISELQSQAAASLAEADILKSTQASLSQSLAGIETEIRELLHSSPRLAQAFTAMNSS